jgi:hypothetical protein
VATQGTVYENNKVGNFVNSPEFQKAAQFLTPDAIQGLIKLFSK